jgi:molybdate transport system ATP-binding protein
MDALAVDVTLPLPAFDVNVAFATAPGAPVAIVGASGSGKTTLLRAIAGLISPARGTIRIGPHAWFDASRRIDLPPAQRRTGFMFQDYALFPHMSVRRNVGFGRRRDAAGVDAVLAQVGIGHLAERLPARLSGGEQQRVALARALASDPQVMLLDEPTSALDAATRREVIGVVGSVIRSAPVPAVLVTHSFEEAASLADRIVVMELGQIAQVGSAAELVASPASPFVAQLTGTNVLPGWATRDDADGMSSVVVAGGLRLRSTMQVADAMPVTMLVAPTDITIDTQPSHGSTLNVVQGTIASIATLGSVVRVQVSFGSGNAGPAASRGVLTAEITSTSCERLALAPGSMVFASFKATSTLLIAA